MNNRNLKNKKAFSLIELSIVILIVGIVIAGVTQTSRLIGQMRLNSARALTQSSPVSSISDLTLWLESTSEKSFELVDQDNNLPVDKWYDINPQLITKINFSQSNSDRQPAYNSTGINGLPTVKFAGTNDLLTVTSSIKTEDITSANQVTVFIVHKKTTNSASSAPLFLAVYGNSQGRIALTIPEFFVSTTTYIFDYSTSFVAGVGRITGNVSSNYFSQATINTIVKYSSTATYRVNGSAVALNTAMTGAFTAAEMGTTVATFSIGGLELADTYYSDANIGEIIIFRRALKSDEITDIEKYLSKKWGISLS